MKIPIVDVNEKTADKNSNNDRVKYVQQLRDYFGKVKELSTGIDLQMVLSSGDVFSCERKTPSDFLSSIADGRLKSKVEDMFKVSKFVAVIVCGLPFKYKNGCVYLDGRETGWTKESVEAKITSLHWSGVAIKYCLPDEYALTVDSLYKIADKGDIHQQEMRRVITFPPLDSRVETLANFHIGTDKNGRKLHVGIKRAESLLRFVKPKIDEDNDPYGTLADAIKWATLMQRVDKDIRPAGWGPESILGFRQVALKLNGKEYMDVLIEDNNNG